MPTAVVLPSSHRALARAALLAALVLIACQKTESPPAAITDDLGKPVALTGTPRRIVSLSPSLTELLFAIGAGSSVVGRTQWCVYPPEVANIPSVGEGLNPNVEVVAGLRPDLVVLYASASNDRALERFTALGIPTLNVHMDHLSDVSRVARILGGITGNGPHADSLAAAFDSAVARARLDTVSNGPNVIILAWDNPPMVLGSGSFLSEIVTLAGGRNAFGDITQPSATVSIETIAARKPDLFLVLASDDPPWARRPEWQVVPAVRDRRFVVTSGTEFEQPSFRALDAVRRLKEQLNRAGR